MQAMQTLKAERIQWKHKHKQTRNIAHNHNHAWGPQLAAIGRPNFAPHRNEALRPTLWRRELNMVRLLPLILQAQVVSMDLEK